eukprot:CAMPEP_0171627962 /NCGR_PEP_ID=MMETSP0990-20121206/21125_1 /TAXON_ID=483369 /ORGANISM="non described non described, Strain CCMP2098" /LENGTH=246 /DNA_ID=CAMNT_0012195999 /DNA_START=653 /DNA_END=1395 /DNA_ORIENTATION=-
MAGNQTGMRMCLDLREAAFGVHERFPALHVKTDEHGCRRTSVKFPGKGGSAADDFFFSDVHMNANGFTDDAALAWPKDTTDFMTRMAQRNPAARRGSNLFPRKASTSDVVPALAQGSISKSETQASVQQVDPSISMKSLDVYHFIALFSIFSTVVEGFNPIRNSCLITHRPKVSLLKGALAKNVDSRTQVTLFLKREEEGEYFQSEQEKLAPMERIKDPLVALGLLSVFIPFILLGVAYAAGWVGN